jgi:RNA polymerase sigma factor (sigma-70 family)
LRVKFLKIFSGKSTDSLSEQERLRQYRRTGDIKLLGAVFEPYLEMLYAVCYKYLRAEDESKDAVMQIFEKLVIDLRNHEIDHFKNWLHSVARNHCLMQLRSRHVFITLEGDIDKEGNGPPYSETLDSAIQLDHQLTSLEKCLEALVAEQRVSVEMFYKQEKCYREISAETGFELSKVKSYIQNGKRNLKLCMDRNGSN